MEKQQLASGKMQVLQSLRSLKEENHSWLFGIIQLGRVLSGVRDRVRRWVSPHLSPVLPNPTAFYAWECINNAGKVMAMAHVTFPQGISIEQQAHL